MCQHKNFTFSCSQIALLTWPTLIYIKKQLWYTWLEIKRSNCSHFEWSTVQLNMNATHIKVQSIISSEIWDWILFLVRSPWFSVGRKNTKMTLPHVFENIYREKNVVCSKKKTFNRVKVKHSKVLFEAINSCQREDIFVKAIIIFANSTWQICAKSQGLIDDCESSGKTQRILRAV